MTPNALSYYTAITFAPVQGFIEKSRKLRDLYGSSFILSYLASAICDAAQNHLINSTTPFRKPFPGYPVISPALINQTQGTPNQILIAGAFPKDLARSTLENAWGQVIEVCQAWIEREVLTDEQGKHFEYCWRREWALWKTHAWEFFWAEGKSITEARENLNEQKRSRDWTGINWQGESSTLSGADGIAYPGMGRKLNPKQLHYGAEETAIKTFYQCLSQKMGEPMVSPREQLSIPELVKRLVTMDKIANDMTRRLPQLEPPESFRELNRWKEEEQAEQSEDPDRENQKLNVWTGWFQGDGDRAGEYLKSQSSNPNSHEDLELHKFSRAMREWGKTLKYELPGINSSQRKVGYAGRIIYAGGDDFLGVLYRNPPDAPLNPKECLETFFYRFRLEVWQKHQQPISVSVGFVWAAPNLPQREVLQHCREAEKSAKTNGRDRLALRILFNSGNYLEWVCPWRYLPVLQDYCDRTPHNGTGTWAHIFNDIAVLEARHAFQGKDYTGKPANNDVEVALALFNVYFSQDNSPTDSKSAWADSDKSEFYGLMQDGQCDRAKYWEQAGLWNLYNGAQKYDPKDGQRLKTGILGDRATFTQDKQPDGVLEESRARQALTAWIINLAKVGFHLHRDYSHE